MSECIDEICKYQSSHDHGNSVDFFVAGSTDEVLVRITNLCPQLLDTKEVFLALQQKFKYQSLDLLDKKGEVARRIAEVLEPVYQQLGRVGHVLQYPN